MSARAMAWAWEVIRGGRVRTLGAMLVLIRLADRADPEGVCWPGHYRTAEDLNLTERTVLSALNDLEGNGLLTREQRTARNGRSLSNNYRLAIAEVDFAIVRKVKRKRDKAAARPSREKQLHPTGETSLRPRGETASPLKGEKQLHPNLKVNLKGAAALQPVDKAAALLRLRELRSELVARPARGRSPAPVATAVDNPLP